MFTMMRLPRRLQKAVIDNGSGAKVVADHDAAAETDEHGTEMTHDSEVLAAPEAIPSNQVDTAPLVR